MTAARVFADGFANTPDLPYFDAVLAEVEAHYCIERSKVFVAGFSSGAWEAYMLGCARGGVVRAGCRDRSRRPAARAPSVLFDPRSRAAAHRRDATQTRCMNIDQDRLGLIQARAPRATPFSRSTVASAPKPKTGRSTRRASATRDALRPMR